jgi:hypothetical protein
MSEDIKFKITADESGAVNAFKRMRNEVLNNDKALQQVGKQGKLTSTALKDAANILGPEFGILGDRIDHISGAFADVNGASLMAKASLVGLVAVGGFEVGRMIGDWAFQTEHWKEQLSDAVDEAKRLNSELLKSNQESMSNMSVDQINQEMAGTMQNMAQLKQEIAAIDAAWYDFYSAESYMGESKQGEVDALREQLDAFKNELRKREQMQVDAEADAIKAQADALAKQATEQERLLQTQTDYLANLDAELVRIRDGEEAYLRLTLAKQGFTEESINAALQLKAEINELSELSKIRADEAGKPGAEQRDNPISISPRGELRGDQQRFITRGVGMKGDEQLLAAAKEQAQRAKEMLTEAKKQTALLAKLPKGVTE